MKQNICIMWFRQDLRLHDNPALEYALSHTYILPIHILDPENAGEWRLGQASRWWLDKSLQKLSQSLLSHQHTLHLFHGNSQTILKNIVGALQHMYPNMDIAITWNKCYEPYNRKLDKTIEEMCVSHICSQYDAEIIEDQHLYSPYNHHDTQAIQDDQINSMHNERNMMHLDTKSVQEQQAINLANTNRNTEQSTIGTYPYNSHLHFTVKSFNGNLLFDPNTIKTQQGNYFQIFTPFFKHCLTQKLIDIATSQQSLDKYTNKQLHVNFAQYDTCFAEYVYKSHSQTYNDAQISNCAEDKTFSSFGEPGEASALNKFEKFLAKTLAHYKDSRNNLYNESGTSLLSPHLHFGEISPKYIWQKCKAMLHASINQSYIHKADAIATVSAAEHIQCFLSEICWREFSTHLLYHLPHITTESIKEAFKAFPWAAQYEKCYTNTQINASDSSISKTQDQQSHTVHHMYADEGIFSFTSTQQDNNQAYRSMQVNTENARAQISANNMKQHMTADGNTSSAQHVQHISNTNTMTTLQAWQYGQTGIPIVDAGMRELLQTGYMHNRARMICASFLTKNLLISWQHGAKWFWDKLLDADLANNSCSWQWVAGCGVDAAPYFRIFNPITQSEKFDPNGTYIRKWVHELSKLSGQSIHEPWKAHHSELLSAGIILGKTYPTPIVDLAHTRAQALQAYKICMQIHKTNASHEGDDNIPT